MTFYTSESFLPDVSLGYLIRRIHQLGQAELEPIFAAQGLTHVQWSALVSIWIGRAQTCADIARDLAYDKGATTRLVDAMEEKGWVTRDRDAQDRRYVNLAVTADGEALALRCRDEVVQRWNAWLVDWPTQDVEQLIALLQRLRTTVETAA